MVTIIKTCGSVTVSPSALNLAPVAIGNGMNRNNSSEIEAILFDLDGVLYVGENSVLIVLI